MLGKAVACAAAIAACLAAVPGSAQDQAGEPARTAEEMVEVAREQWRSPNLRKCPEAKPGEIVVCQSDDAEFRVESSTDEAIREGKPVSDGIPRAPYVMGLPECGVEVTCHRIGRARPAPLMIDLAALPHPLTPEEAAHVFRAGDPPPEGATPAAASPAAAP